MNARVAILGTGLIGASIGLALRRKPSFARPVEQARPLHRSAQNAVVGWDARPLNSRAAKRRGAITAIAKSMEEAVAGAGVVVIAVPLDAAVKLAPRVIAAVPPDALVLDVAPVKRPMLRAVRPALRKRPDVRYVSAHPMAGREKAGPAHADAGLFVARPFALVIDPSVSSRQAVAAAAAVARALGAVPVRVTAAGHDRAVAAVSALPQLSSIALMLAVAASGGAAAKALAGPGLKDATRLAASPYSVWRPALAANRRELLRCLGALRRAAADVGRAARQADVRALARLFSKAGAARRRVVGA